jgi:hypothetical protein
LNEEPCREKKGVAGELRDDERGRRRRKLEHMERRRTRRGARPSSSAM